MHSFAIEVPQRARSNRTLANAVFANSARHLSGVTDFDTLIADQYLQECLRTLIPALEDGEAVMDDNFLASLVILRMLEEMDGMCMPWNSWRCTHYCQCHSSDQICKVTSLALKRSFVHSELTQSHLALVKQLDGVLSDKKFSAH